MNGCPITGDAEVELTHGKTRDEDELRWLRADPETHVSTELLEHMDPREREFLTAAYEIGEPCPYYRQTRHVRLRPGVEPVTARREESEHA